MKIKVAQLEALKNREARRESQEIVTMYRSEVQKVIEEKARADALDIVEHLHGTAPKALRRINELVQSRDEQIATKNAHFVVEQIVGKAKQRTESLNVNVNIDVLAD